MLPEPIFNTYTQYKSDTLRIATWLASTAARCGYTTPSDDAVNALTRNGAANEDGVEVKPQKLKGRARKLAKEAAARDVKATKEAEAQRLKKEIEEAARQSVSGKGERANGVNVNGDGGSSLRRNM